MIHPIFFNEMIVIIANSFVGEIGIDDMDVIGNFFATLGGMMLFNSSYLSRFASREEVIDDSKDDIETIKKSIEKINEEMKSIKFDKS